MSLTFLYIVTAVYLYCHILELAKTVEKAGLDNMLEDFEPWSSQHFPNENLLLRDTDMFWEYTAKYFCLKITIK